MVLWKFPASNGNNFEIETTGFEGIRLIALTHDTASTFEEHLILAEM